MHLIRAPSRARAHIHDDIIRALLFSSIFAWALATTTMPDPRFTRLRSDPRFRTLKRHKNKVAVDSRFNSVFSRDKKKPQMYALLVFDPRAAPAAAPAVLFVLRVSAARRDIVVFRLLWQQRPHDVLQLRQVVVLPPRVRVHVGDVLLRIHRLDGVGVLLRCNHNPLF
jgi:hypothetical protein